MRLPLDLTYEQRERADGSQDLEGSFRTTLPLPAGTLLSHTLNYRQIGGLDRFDGEVDINVDWQEWLIRGGYRYVAEEDDPRGTSYSLQIDRSLTDTATLRLGATHDVVSGGTQTNGSFNWRTKYFDIGLGASYDDQQEEARAQLSLNFGFGRDHERSRWVMSSEDLAETGLSRSLVYLDNNANGQRDEGDEPLEGVRIGANSGADNVTDASGEILITSLDAGRPVVLSLDPASLPDPYMMPALESIEIVPRPGRIQRLEYPVVRAGTVEGTTLFASADGDRPVGNVRLELVNARGEVVAATLSGFDGFYAFDFVRPGAYDLRLEPARARELGVGTQSIAHVAVGPDGSVIRGMDLVLHRESAATMLASAAPSVTPRPAIAASVAEPPRPVATMLASAAPMVAAPAPAPPSIPAVIAAPPPHVALVPVAARPAPQPRPVLAASTPIAASAAAPVASASGMLVFDLGGRRIPVPHIELSLRSRDSGIVRTLHSDGRGVFTLTGLAAGAYEVTPNRQSLASRSLRDRRRLAGGDFKRRGRSATRRAGRAPD